jgi:hypothetical protein
MRDRKLTIEEIQIREELSRRKNETSIERIARMAASWRAAHPGPHVPNLADVLEKGRRLHESIERKDANGEALNGEEKQWKAERVERRLRWAEDEKILARRHAARIARQQIQEARAVKTETPEASSFTVPAEEPVALPVAQQWCPERVPQYLPERQGERSPELSFERAGKDGWML